MRYGILARDEYTAAGDDSDLYVLVIEVAAGSRQEASDKAKQIADTNNLEIEGRHDGLSCYEIVQTEAEIKDAIHRLRVEHNALLDLKKVVVKEIVNEAVTETIEQTIEEAANESSVKAGQGKTNGEEKELKMWNVKLKQGGMPSKHVTLQIKATNDQEAGDKALEEVSANKHFSEFGDDTDEIEITHIEQI